MDKAIPISAKISTARAKFFLLVLVSEPKAHTNIIMILTQGMYNKRRVIIQSPKVIGGSFSVPYGAGAGW